MIRAFTWGTFNHIHDGHRILLNKIKTNCDQLHIILLPNKEVFENKRIIVQSETSRREILLKLRISDFVHIDSYNMGLKSLLKYNPDIFVVGYDQNTVWEKRLFSFIKMNKLKTKIIKFGKFADGIHSCKLR